MLNKSIFVTVGSTQFDELIQTIDSQEIQQILHKHQYTRILYQIGNGLYIPKNGEYFRTKTFLTKEYMDADLIICHCGAGTILECLRLNKKCIVVNNDTLMNNHQMELFQVLTKENYVSGITSTKQLSSIEKQLREVEQLKQYPLPKQNIIDQVINIVQPKETLQYFKDLQLKSIKSINVQKQFLLQVHQLCKKFTEDLQQSYMLLSVQVDDEETLIQNTAISNYILSISKMLKQRNVILYEESIEPFLQFEENYLEQNRENLNKFTSLIDQMSTYHDILKNKAQDYYDMNSRNQIFSTQSKEEQYKISLENMNHQWGQFFQKTPLFFESYQLNEASKLTLMEQIYSKFIGSLEEMFQQQGSSTIKKLKDSFCNQKQKWNTKNPYSEMVASNSKILEFYIEKKLDVFMSRDEYYRKQTALLLQAADKSKNQGLSEDDLRLIKQCLTKKMSQPSNIIYKIKIIPFFSFKEREDIIQYLQITQNIKLGSNFQVRLFKMLFIRLFKCFSQDYQNNQKYVLHLLSMMCVSLQIQNEMGLPILSLVSQHCEIFFSQKIWNTIYEEILQNYSYQKQIIELGQQYVNLKLISNKSICFPKDIDQKNSTFLGIFNKSRKITINEGLNILNLLLMASNLKLEFSSKIIMQLVEQNNMKQSHCLNFIELQECNHMLKPLKSSKRVIQSKYQSKNIYAISKSLKFLYFPTDYLNIITLSKILTKPFKKKMIQYYLITAQPKIRIFLWNQLLDSDIDYLTISQNQLKSSSKLSRDIERSIMVDINRSFVSAVEDKQSILEMYAPKLEKLLRLHAFDNPIISYYQGMNMLMVFLLYVTNLDEQLSFKMFRALLDKMLSDIFLEGLKSMKLHFYILDRMIAIHLPKLFIHWKTLQIEIPQFATPWYVTLFTHSINLNNQIGINDTCFAIFDMIVAKGWVGFYQSVLGLLKFYADSLLLMDFDLTQQFLNHLSKSSFNNLNPFKNMPPYLGVKQSRINISKGMIREIEKEYYQLREQIDHINLHHL